MYLCNRKFKGLNMKNIYDFKLNVDERMMNIISDIDRLNERWTAMEKKKSQPLKQIKHLKDVAVIRSIGASVRIEGSKITDEEIEVLLKNEGIEKPEDKDYQGIMGYFDALKTVLKSYEKFPIEENNIKNLHKTLMKYNSKDEQHKGNYKTRRNAAEVLFPSGVKEVIFRTAEAGLATENAVRRLIEWYHNDMEIHPLIKNATFIYEFLNIHPFQDGNGHLSRLLSTLLLLKNEYKWMQYVSYECEIEKRKNEYYIVLRNCQTQRPYENITDWVLLYLNALKNLQSKLMRQLEPKGTDKPLSPREQTILDIIRNCQGMKSKDIARRVAISDLSVKRALAELQAKGFVKKYGNGISTSYWTR